MKSHDGERRVNKLDGGKADARRRFHKAQRAAGKRRSREEHWILCDDCGTAINVCPCERTEDHYAVFVPHPNWRKPKIFPTLCGHCQHERDRSTPGYKF